MEGKALCQHVSWVWWCLHSFLQARNWTCLPRAEKWESGALEWSIAWEQDGALPEETYSLSSHVNIRTEVMDILVRNPDGKC